MGIAPALAFACGEVGPAVTHDAWTTLPTENAPDPQPASPSVVNGRILHTAVWTGTEMLIWGGQQYAEDFFNSGSAYDPATDSWRALSMAGAPSPRSGHSAIWDGQEMLVWGGFNVLRGGPQADGGRYDPSTDSWRAMSTAGAPSARTDHTAVWKRTEMLVWGGSGKNGSVGDGAAYNPGTDTWRPLTGAGAPSPRGRHTAVWTGTEMLIWGGEFTNPQTAISIISPLGNGAAYDPPANAWRPLSTNRAPTPRRHHTAVWTGIQMLIWGGQGGGQGLGESLGDGAAYDPADDEWTPLGPESALSGRSDHTAVWTGSAMLIWGGSGTNERGIFAPLGDGAAYDPAQGAWVGLNEDEAPAPRTKHTATWTGEEMIVWGGARFNKGFYNDGAAYRP